MPRARLHIYTAAVCLGIKKRAELMMDASSNLTAISGEHQVNTLIYCMGDDEARDVLRSGTLGNDPDQRQYNKVNDGFHSLLI